MQKIIFSFITLAFTLAFAQTEQPQEIQSVQQSEKNVWLEINLPFSRNGGFGDALADSRKNSNGSYGWTLGWEPFRNKTFDSKVKSIFRGVGFTFNTTINNNKPNKLYDVYLGRIYDVLSPFEVTRTCGGRLPGTGSQCVACGFDNYGVGRLCTVQDVYGRLSPIKYSAGSVAFGMYVPMHIAKLIVEAGVNARLHLVREGNRSDQLKASAEQSYAGTLRVAYPVRKNISAVSGFEQSFLGSKSGDKRFKYRAFTIGASVRW